MNVGLVLLVSAAALALMGVAGYRAARRSASKSRYAAMSVFGHGALATSGVLAFLLFFHLDRMWPLTLHLESPSQVWADILNCDIEVSCVAATILALFGTVLVASFAVSQGSARLLLRRYRKHEDARASDELARRNPPPRGTRLLVVEDDDVDAFSLAVLRQGGPHGFRGEDVIVVTSALLDLLTDDEADAVLAHEAAHVAARDDRYLPFFQVLAALLFFDPVLRLLRRRVARHHELAADADSVYATRRPLSLARALLKVYLAGKPNARPTGLFGQGSRTEILERIEALLALDAKGLSG